MDRAFKTVGVSNGVLLVSAGPAENQDMREDNTMCEEEEWEQRGAAGKEPFGIPRRSASFPSVAPHFLDPRPMSTRTGSPEDPPPADPEELVAALNALLGVLSLSRIRLETPQDLTPALLLGVLESMLRARLPVPPATRAARTRAARVDAMKVFLAVLQTDVLAEDVGLADVDPRRLADGEWDECVFVAELLVWLARDMAYLPEDDDGAPESSGMAAARSAVTIQEPDRSAVTATVKRHAHKESVTSMRTADSNPFIVRPRLRAAAQPAHDPSPRRTYTSPQRSYSPPSPIPSSHPSRTPSPPNVTHTGSSLGLSFRPPRASSPARLPDEDEEGEDTQLCTCDPDASFASGATFCTCSHAGDEHPSPPPESPPSRRRGSTPVVDTYSRRRSLEPSASRRPSLEPAASTSRRISQPPASTSRRPSVEPPSAASSGRAPVRYDGWIARVEGDVEAFEAAHPPRPARRRPPALDPLYPTTHPSSYPSASAPDSRHPTTHPSSYPSASAPVSHHPPAQESCYPPALASPVELTGRGSRRGRNPTRHVSPAQHTLALMAERARLLGELAALRRAR